MTLVQCGEFAILAPATLKTPTLARQFSQIMKKEGISLAEVLDGLAEERVLALEKQNKVDSTT